METLAQSKGEESTAGINGGSRFRGDSSPDKDLARYPLRPPVTADGWTVRFAVLRYRLAGPKGSRILTSLIIRSFAGMSTGPPRVVLQFFM